MIRQVFYVDVAEREKYDAHTIGLALCITPGRPSYETHYDVWVRCKDTVCRVCGGDILAGELYIMARAPGGKGKTLHCQKCFLLLAFPHPHCKLYRRIEVE